MAVSAAVDDAGGAGDAAADGIRAAHADEEPVGENMPLALAKAMEDDLLKYKIEPQAAVLIFFKDEA
eukprot:2628987-Pleurochrysis_carterae.AAC.1